MNFRETDMYPYVAKFLEEHGYKVSAEVKRCDIVAIKDDTLVIVELKRSFGLKLIYQALRRQRLTPLVFVCIPRPRLLCGRSYSDMMTLVKQLGLGMLFVSIDSDLPETYIATAPPGFMPSGAAPLTKPRRLDKKAQRNVLKEVTGRSFNSNTGGSTRTKQHTAYREESIKIACALEAIGSSSPKLLKNSYACRQDCSSILHRNSYGWFDHPAKSIYALSPTGQAFLDEDQTFRNIINLYRDKFSKGFV